VHIRRRRALTRHAQNSLATKQLARLTSAFVFVNLGATFLIIIVLLATTPRADMHPANYVFGSAGVVNQTGGWNTGLAFLFGLLSVQWTVRSVCGCMVGAS
jgi:amino acid transporter